MPAAFLIRNDSTGVELTQQCTIGMVSIVSPGHLRFQSYRTLGRHDLAVRGSGNQGPRLPFQIPGSTVAFWVMAVLSSVTASVC